MAGYVDKSYAIKPKLHKRRQQLTCRSAVSSNYRATPITPCMLWQYCRSVCLSVCHTCGAYLNELSCFFQLRLYPRPTLHCTIKGFGFSANKGSYCLRNLHRFFSPHHVVNRTRRSQGAEYTKRMASFTILDSQCRRKGQHCY